MFYKITFCILGISSVIGWNAVLSSLPFFASKFGPRVFTQYTIFVQCGNFLLGAAMPYIAQKFKLVSRIAGGMTILSLILMFFPVLAQIAPNDKGYFISLGLSFLIGSFNSIAQNSMIALAGQEGDNLNSIYWMATGISGLIMAVLNITLNASLAQFENGALYSAVIFFIVASLMSLSAIILTVKYVKRKEDDQFRERQLSQSYTINLDVSDDDDIVEMQPYNSNSDNNNPPDIQQIQNLQQQQQQLSESRKEYQSLTTGNVENNSFWQKVKIAIYHAKLIPLFIWMIYVTTFCIFPGVTVSSVQFTIKFLNQKKQLWAQLMLNLTYQIGDLTGKALGGMDRFQTQKIQFTVVILRMLIIVLALLVSYQIGWIFNSDWLPFLNMFLLASTNGFCTSGLMSLGPKKANGKPKVIETIGFIAAFCLSCGIATGSLIAYPMDPKTVIEYRYD